MSLPSVLCVIMLCLVAILPKTVHSQPAANFTNAVPKPHLSLNPVNESVWENGIGEGLRAGAQSITLSVGGTYGLAIFGSREAHDLGLVSVSYGRVLGDTRGRDHWYRGNL